MSMSVIKETCGQCTKMALKALGFIGLGAAALTAFVLALQYAVIPFFQFTVNPLYAQYEQWVLSHKGYTALVVLGALSVLGAWALCIAVKLYKQKETKGGLVFSGLTTLTLVMIALTAAPAWPYCFVKNSGALAVISFLDHVCVYGPIIAIGAFAFWFILDGMSPSP